MMKILFIAIVLIITIKCSAQTDSLIMELKDGTVHIYSLSEISEITLSPVLAGLEEESIQTILSSFVLNQNYPNPFNPFTTISYEIGKPGPVKVNIYNIQGKLIRSLLHSDEPSGTHMVIWDGKNDSGIMVSSGTYFYTMVFNNTTLTKKMIFLK